MSNPINIDQAYNFNLNNQVNRDLKDRVEVVELDKSNGNVELKSTYDFAVGTEIYLAYSEKTGHAIYYRIYRFKPVLFNVDVLTVQLSDKEITERYKIEKGVKDLFSEVAFAEVFLLESSKINFETSVFTLNEIEPILSKYYKNKIDKNRFNKVMKRFFDRFLIGASFSDWTVTDEWYNNLKLY